MKTNVNSLRNLAQNAGIEKNTRKKFAETTKAYIIRFDGDADEMIDSINARSTIARARALGLSEPGSVLLDAASNISNQDTRTIKLLQLIEQRQASLVRAILQFEADCNGTLLQDIEVDDCADDDDDDDFEGGE